MKLRVVTITDDPTFYRGCEKDTKEFPHLIPHVEDGIEMFVIGNNNFWKVKDFFYATRITEFSVDDEAIK